MLKRFSFFFLFIFLIREIPAQQTGNPLEAKTCTISGTANGREGNVIGAYIYDDYITSTEKKLGETLVNDSGKFSLTIEVDEVSYIFLKCKNVHGFLFAEPGRKVEMIFPDRDPKAQVNPNVDYEVPSQIYISDSTDMN